MSWLANAIAESIWTVTFVPASISSLMELRVSSRTMAVATFSGTLENYAVMMNVVIFPMYFISGALYPFAMLPDALRAAALVNPFTYGVDLVKHAMPYAHGAFGAPELPLAWDLEIGRAHV